MYRYVLNLIVNRSELCISIESVFDESGLYSPRWILFTINAIMALLSMRMWNKPKSSSLDIVHVFETRTLAIKTEQQL